MDINQTLQPVIQSLLDDMRSSLQDEFKKSLESEILKKIAESETEAIIKVKVEETIDRKIEKFNFHDLSHENLQKALHRVNDQIEKTLMASANTQIQSFIKQRTSSLDFNQIVNAMVEQKLARMLDEKVFPSQSIPNKSINFAGLTLSGDHIKGGIISNFGSTGIEDRSTFVQLTLMDHASAFEGPLWAPSAKITGNITVGGTVKFTGDIDTDTPAMDKLITVTSERTKNSIDRAMFEKYSEVILGKIRSDGLDLDTFTQNGRPVVTGNALGTHISQSNLQKLGLVRDLQTQGESYLSETLYVTKDRVGVNTMDPSYALSVWDEEVEVSITKKGQETAFLGTPRHQSLVVGSNLKDNLICNPDGSVTIKTLKIANNKMSSAPAIPSTESEKGHIVWNENPAPGSVIGWVCLGGSLWAKFGKIE